MPEPASVFGEKSRLRALLDHFSVIDDPREPWRVAHPLPEVLLLVVCGTIADCDDYDHIAAWGEAHLPFLREMLPYHHGVPGGRWLTLLMNRIDPGLFSSCFTAWVRATWPERPEFVAIDGKTSRRSHDRGHGQAPVHLVSAFATTARLVLGQEAVSDKSNEITAIPVLLERLSANGGLTGATVSIDAMACNATIAGAITAAGAHYLLAVKANQPTLRAEIEAYFATAPAEAVCVASDLDKGHGRIEERTVWISRETDWLAGDRRFPGELRLPGATTIVKVCSRTELKDRCRTDTRYYISSAALTAQAAADAVRGHWGIENRLHWVLDVVFGEDQARLRTGHGAKNMVVVRHFAINLVRAVTDKKSIKLRRKAAAWDARYLASILGLSTR
ncbi:ISAs1 family transposase [Azospirillum rugosum]|uniref:Transposase YbfD/YdcC n=1 Tax=Azospirillum rugosum TaxID=416170 RepID=A0ABS4SGU5_9PROT|nr:ISAs1 family transposase [Azospirillum rugosum]MBP2290650.1 putative transposase YbfD/YdcC [Azospirillum rugosum]MDQ0525538.1 putative transposase YbfD/YdcC [Azospirillum rugosum]